MTALKDSFTSTGSKLMWHTEAMKGLREGKPRVITCHVMPTDRCAHRCGFCSVGQRAGDVLPMDTIFGFVNALKRHGLLSVIVSGGGNPILYKCPETGATFDDLIDEFHKRDLQIGVISDGMPLKDYGGRKSWKTVKPETLDKMTWLRISMAGLDHDENRVDVPDIDPSKTTLGFSYIAHDLFFDAEEKFHGRVSTELDIVSKDRSSVREWRFKDRVTTLTDQFSHYCTTYQPKYLRALPNCLEPNLIEERCRILQEMCDKVNSVVGKAVAFVQHKPPRAPLHCWNGYVHPTLAPDSFVYSCDSVVLAAADIGYKTGNPNHTFDSPWRLCRWDEVEDRLFKKPIGSLVDSQRLCAGCVFANQQAILEGVVDGTADLTPPTTPPEHANFV